MTGAAEQVNQATEGRTYEVRVAVELVEQVFRGGELSAGPLRIDDGVPPGAELVGARVDGWKRQLVLRFTTDPDFLHDPDPAIPVTPVVHRGEPQNLSAAFLAGADFAHRFARGCSLPQYLVKVVEDEAAKLKLQGKL